MQKKTKISGITFAISDTPALAQARPAGQAEIRIEKNNHAKHPAGAFGVWWLGMKIGYIPDKERELQDEISQRLAAGEPVSVTINDYCYKDNSGWNNNHSGELGAVTVVVCTGGDGATKEQNGKIYDRISSVCKYFDPDDKSNLTRWMINTFGTHAEYEAYMKEASEKGTSMHGALEDYFSGKVTPRLDARPKNLKKFTDRYDVSAISAEERLFDDGLLVTGQYDLFARVYDKLESKDLGEVVLDWKSAKRVYLSYAVQASFYAFVKGREIGRPVGAMIVAFGGAPDVKVLTPKQAEMGYSLVAHIRDCEALAREL